MKVAVVFNPVKAEERELRNALHEEIPAAESDLRFYETDADDQGEAAAKRAVADEPDLIIVAGGDGTVRIAAEQLAGTRIPLGIVPAGTGNLLARNLHLPLISFDSAIRVAVHGQTDTIDIARAVVTKEDGEEHEYPFVVMAGVGLDAATMAETDSELKKKVGWVAYVGGLLKALKEVHKVNVRSVADGGDVEEFKANTIMIGNAGMVQGNVRFMPDAELDDGLLDIAVLNPSGPLSWMQVMHEVASNSSPIQRELRKMSVLPDRKSIPELQFGQMKRIELEFDEPIELQVDGDLVGKVVKLRCHVQRAALNVRIKK